MEINLYEFRLGSRVWRYAACEDNVRDLNNIVWLAAAINHDRINQSGEAVADAGTIRCDRGLIPAQIWMLSPPTRIMDIRILSVVVQRNEYMGDSTEETEPLSREVNGIQPVVRYVGEIVQASLGTPGVVVFQSETLAATMSRSGLRLGWQRQCPHAVYDERTCKANKAANQIDCVIATVTGSIITVTGLGTHPDNHFAAGLLEYDHNLKGTETLMIEASTGNTLLIFGPAIDLYPGMAIRVFRGCAQTPASCQSFGNYDNYGGIPNLPGKSPFSGVDSPIF